MSRPQGKTPARPNLRNLGRALGYLNRYRGIASAAVVALLISIAAQLAVPQMVQVILDAVTRGMTQVGAAGVPPEITRALMGGVGLIVLFAMARGAFAFSQAFMAEKLSQSIAFDFRNELFAKIQRLSFSYHDRNRTGQLMVRATDDVEKVRMFVGQGMLMALQAVVLLTGALALLVATNWQLTLIVLTILPLALVMFMFFGSATQPLFVQVQQRVSALNTTLQESLAGIRVIKAFGREAQAIDRFQAQAGDVLDQQLRVARFFSFLFPSIFLVMSLGQIAVIYFGGRQILEGTLTIGEWQKFALYVVFVFFPIGQLGIIMGLMRPARPRADRSCETLPAPTDGADRPGAAVLPSVRGQVEFREVGFRYFNSSDPVLARISLQAQPGETVALLGATGSGKTSIINLIPRFYDASEGQILIDGYDVREVKIDSLRRQIGIVLQETNLFTGTIRENIAFGRPDASDEEVVTAAKAAAAHDFISGFPAGYDTPVGERGATLSGGQKQRIAIARALLLDPRILILDDSTSSVDVTTEAQIQHALDRLMQGRTSFVIAQRISTVLNADQILVLDKGQIVAQGRHADLMETSAIYAEIYRSQLVEDAHEAAAPDTVTATAATRAIAD